VLSATVGGTLRQDARFARVYALCSLGAPLFGGLKGGVGGGPVVVDHSTHHHGRSVVSVVRHDQG
jgi:hypothetical protein